MAVSGGVAVCAATPACSADARSTKGTAIATTVALPAVVSSLRLVSCPVGFFAMGILGTSCADDT